MNEPSGKYLLLWKGKQSGPYGLDEIQARLASGDISRVHQIHADGVWQLLDEFLSKLRVADLEAKRAEARQRERAAKEMQRLADAGMGSDASENRAPDDSPVGPGERPAPSRASSRGHRRRSSQKSARDFADEGEREYDHWNDSDQGDRTSGFAITAFAVACFSSLITLAAGVALSSQISVSALAICDLVPFLDVVAWSVSLTLGHIALRQIARDESLRGRGLAIAALCTTYFLVVVGLTVVFLMLANHQKF